MLLVLAEFKCSFLLMRFQFLKYMKGKGLFCIFLGTLLFDGFGTGDLLGVAMIVIGIIYICVSCGVNFFE